jgi:hypothetical protein
VQKRDGIRISSYASDKPEYLHLAKRSYRMAIGRESIDTFSLEISKTFGTISAKLVGVGAVSQRLIPTSEQPSLLTRRDDGKRFVVHADEKLAAFLELESAIRAVSL